MANGKPGDHPVTDVVEWQMQVFTPETDELIRDIARYNSNRWAASNPFMSVEPLLFDARADRGQEPKLRDALVALRDHLSRRHKPSDSG
ncbi:MAG TPA: hypothetical protein VF232_09415 [Gaiellaceae bacterium]